MTSRDDTVTLKIGGDTHAGWTEVEIDASLTEVCRTFSVGVTERWPGQQATRRIAPGTACQVVIGETTLITGYVNDVDISYDGQSHNVTIRGRDRTGDLIDCSALVAGVGSWTGTSVMRIAADLCDPFGIKIVSTVSDTRKVLAGHSIQMGETVWECLDRAIRQYGLLAMADADGNLVLTRPGSAGALAEARLGANILAGSCGFSERELFRDYYLLGQFPGSNESYSDPRITTGASAHASDPNVARYRPLIVQTEANTCDMAFLPTRAAWEAAVRSGRARRPTITVVGWRDAKGSLYAPNTMIRLEDDFLGIHETLLVAGVRLTLSDNGQLAELSLARKSAFDPAPLTSLAPYENGAGGGQ
ncbi:MAG: hypothetical protein RLZZ501_1741 [Pseudomonadota bacterium]|jgi:prophage tail gpP-like protein